MAIDRLIEIVMGQLEPSFFEAGYISDDDVRINLVRQCVADLGHHGRHRQLL